MKKLVRRKENLLEMLINSIEEIDNKEDKISFMNTVKRKLHDISSFKNEPIDCVIWVKENEVEANNYNPNKVAPPEMELLRHSISNDGYTQPIVSFNKDKKYIIIDGFHRSRVGKECIDVKNRVEGYLPITIINKENEDMKDRMASTIRHNRARGVHGVESMSTLVAELYFSGWSNKRIGRELGMDKDEVLRLKQFTGIGNLFESRDFSKSWEFNEE